MIKKLLQNIIDGARDRSEATKQNFTTLSAADVKNYVDHNREAVIEMLGGRSPTGEELYAVADDIGSSVSRVLTVRASEIGVIGLHKIREISDICKTVSLEAYKVLSKPACCDNA